jgi:tRNA(adenine34) deaminase
MDCASADYWMQEALVEARKAEAAGEVPVGAVLLINNKIFARGHNRSIAANDPTAHAEILALRQASHAMRNYRLPGAVLVVTVEPCAMCVGAMIHARIEDLVYGAPDPKAGAVDSHFHLAAAPELNHKIEVITGGVLADQCGDLLRTFFESRRK